MNKTEFKKEYSFARKAEWQFNVHMSNSNYPCGHDDMLYEQFDHNKAKYLEDKPVIAYVLEARYDEDYLERRLENSRWNCQESLKRDIKYRLSA